jgi:2-oxoglutarate ferredoxin oxidoreductase subunit gamma
VKRYEARISGFGGQGVILAGIILAEAGGVHEGLRVLQTQSYGPESRGSACKADVILSEDIIRYPGVRQLDLLVALTQDACDKFAQELKPEGVLIYDPLLVKKPPQGIKRTYAVAATHIAEGLGRKIAANMVALGAVAVLADAVKPESLEQAVLARSPRNTGEGNRQAFRAGVEAAQEARGQSL